MKSNMKQILSAIKTSQFSGITASTTNYFPNLFEVLTGKTVTHQDRKNFKILKNWIEENRVKTITASELNADFDKNAKSAKNELSLITGLGGFSSRKFVNGNVKFKITNTHVPLVLDIDEKNVEGFSRVEEVKKYLNGFDEVVCTFTSTSGRGCKAVVIVESKFFVDGHGNYDSNTLNDFVVLKWANEKLNERFADVFKVQKDMNEKEKFKIDFLPIHQLFAIPTDFTFNIKESAVVFDITKFASELGMDSFEKRLEYKTSISNGKLSNIKLKHIESNKNKARFVKFPSVFNDEMSKTIIDKLKLATLSKFTKEGRRAYRDLGLVLNQNAINPNFAWVYLVELNPEIAKDAAIKRNFFASFNDKKDQFGVKTSFTSNKVKKTIEIEKNIGNLDEAIRTLGKKGIIIAPTGAGKTTAVVKLEMQKIIVVPNQTLVEQAFNAAQKHNKNGNLIGTFYEKSKQSVGFHTVITTYSSLPTLVKELGDTFANYTLFVDEYHNIATSSSTNYMRDENANLCEILLKHDSYYCYSATYVPVYHAALNLLDVVVYKRTQNTKKTAQFFDYNTKDNKASAVLHQILSNINENTTQMLYLNNKTSALDAYIELFEQKKIKYAIVNADVKSGVDYQNIAQKSVLTEGVDVLITTSLLKEGVSIENCEGKNIIIHVAEALGNIGAVEIEQLSNRFRNAGEIQAFIYRPNKNREIKEKANTEWFVYSNSNRLKLMLEATPFSKYDEIILSLDTINVFNFNETTQNYEVCECALSYRAYQYEMSLESNDIAYFEAKMTNFGWIMDNIITQRVERELVEQADEALSSAKLGHQEKINEYILKLSEYIEQNEKIMRFETELSIEDVKKIERRVLFFFDNIKTENLGQFIIEHASTESAFTTSKYRVAIQQMLTSKAMKNDKLTKVFKVIISEFEMNVAYESTEVIKIIRSKIKSYEKKLVLTDEKALKLFKSLFSVVQERKTVNKSKKTFFYTTSTNPFGDTIYQPIKNLESAIQDVLDAIA